MKQKFARADRDHQFIVLDGREYRVVRTIVCYERCDFGHEGERASFVFRRVEDIRVAAQGPARTIVCVVPLLGGSAEAACNFRKSGPVTVQADGQTITGVEITAPAGRAGINFNGHSYVAVYDVIVHHKDRAGIAVHGGHGNFIQNAIIDGGTGTSGDNIYCYGSSDLWVSNSRVTGGYRGIEINQCGGAMLDGIEGHDQQGADGAGGQLVSFLNSANGSLSNFSNVNAPGNKSGGDAVNAWRARNIRVSGGFIDGVQAPNGVGVQADEATTNMVVSDVDVVHSFNGFAAYGAGGNSISFSNVRVRDAICSSSQGVPSSGNIPFIGPCTHDDPACTFGGKWNVAFVSAVYFNLCAGSPPTYNQAGMTRADIVMKDFVPRTPFKAQLCQ